MKDFYSLTELKQVKALADPLRVRVLDALCRKPQTTKQIALLLDEKPTKLYHHVEALERVGLIRLTETRQNRGTIEKYYESIAKRFSVDRKLLSVMSDETETEVAGIFIAALEETIAEIEESFNSKLVKPEDGNATVILSRGHISVTKTQLAELLRKMEAWLKECHSANDKKGSEHYGMTVAFYPVKERTETRSAKRAAKTKPAKKSAK
jgi:DNA-binding transcriptional ArsR family regulator